jgi:hypothetical protein
MQIAGARREANLTQVELAERIGIGTWQLDRIEHGRLDPAGYLDAIGEALGQPIAVRRPRVAKATEAHAGPIPVVEAAGLRRLLVVGSLVVLILVRFFTETVGVLPNGATFIDIPVFLLLVLAVSIFAGDDEPRARFGRNEMLLAGAFLGWSALSAIVNLGRVAPAPVVLFLYGFVAPVGIGVAVHRLWPPGNTRYLANVLLALVVIQLLVVVGIDTPRYISSRNPDVISGTFGENGYQLVTFLIAIIAGFGAAMAHDKGSPFARAGLILIGPCVVTMIFVQYRVMIVVLVLTAVVIVPLITGRRARGALAVLIVGGLFVFGLQFVLANFSELKYGGAIDSVKSDRSQLIGLRADVALNVADLYADKPRYMFTGTGPGTFSSRAWRTFADTRQVRTASSAPVAKALLGGGSYHTDVADKYTVKSYNAPTIVSGSSAVSQPFSSYAALAAESGLPGLAIMTAIWIMGMVRAVRIAAARVRRKALRDPVLPVAIMAATLFVVLLQLAVIENWWEVTRITFLAWALLAIAGREDHAARPAGP